MHKKSIFISIEGIDGAGKTMQTKALTANLIKLGRQVCPTFEPTNSPLGKAVRSLLSDDTKYPAVSELFLLMADRVHHANSIISPALTSGQDVVTDRYLDSTFAYQGIKIGDLDWLENWTKQNLVLPQITLWIDLSPQLALQRIAQRNINDKKSELAQIEKFEKESILRMVAQNYEKIYKNNGNRIVKIDGSQDFDQVSIAIFNAVKKYIDSIDAH